MGQGRVVIARKHTGGTSSGKLISYLILGFIVGISLGYVMMGTARAIMETRDNQHFQGHKKSQKPPAQVAGTQTRRAGGGRKKSSRPPPPPPQPDAQIHILTTSNGSPYQNYQMRIAYATYLITLTMPGGKRYVGFTRILHRTEPDELMDEIPTFRADPLQPECDDWCEYPVSDRANAVQQFFDAAEQDPEMIKAPWIYMIESDYVFMKPLELPPPGTPPTGGKAWAFPFDYIQPHLFPDDMKKLWPELVDVNKVPNTGPAPLLMTVEDWKKITPDWERFAAAIEADDEMKKKLGWVREMYGFSLALVKNGLQVDLTPPGESLFISQLPVDQALGKAHAYHYTQCTIYKTIVGDADVWKYDKRFYTSSDDAMFVPRIEEPPAFREGEWKFIEGNPVTQEVHEAITEMIKRMNRGIGSLKDLRP